MISSDLIANVTWELQSNNENRKLPRSRAKYLYHTETFRTLSHRESIDGDNYAYYYITTAKAQIKINNLPLPYYPQRDPITLQQNHFETTNSTDNQNPHL